jgi:hypothetical protein
VRIFALTTSLFVTASVLVACSQSEFAGEAGQGVRLNKKKTPLDNPNNSDTPGINDNPGIDDGLMTDDGGEIKLVDAELIISKSTDRARWKNCLYAGIDGQPDVEIGCNRVSPGGTRLEQKSTSIKLKTNECNQLRLTLHTQKDGQNATSPNISTVGQASRFQIRRLAPSKFAINANDNFDNDWMDLNVTIYTENPKIKFTIKGSNFTCD